MRALWSLFRAVLMLCAQISIPISVVGFLGGIVFKNAWNPGVCTPAVFVLLLMLSRLYLLTPVMRTSLMFALQKYPFDVYVDDVLLVPIVKGT